MEVQLTWFVELDLDGVTKLATLARHALVDHQIHAHIVEVMYRVEQSNPPVRCSCLGAKADTVPPQIWLGIFCSATDEEYTAAIQHFESEGWMLLSERLGGRPLAKQTRPGPHAELGVDIESLPPTDDLSRTQQARTRWAAAPAHQ